MGGTREQREIGNVGREGPERGNREREGTEGGRYGTERGNRGREGTGGGREQVANIGFCCAPTSSRMEMNIVSLSFCALVRGFFWLILFGCNNG